MSPATRITGIHRTSGSCTSSAWARFDSRSPGRGSFQTGAGHPNAAGLDFYDRLVDELLANQLEPFVTLYHWDLPQALEERGGWPARETVDGFAEYVQIVAARLGDRVKYWITQNEPWVISWLGYGWGFHAPGRTSDADALAAAHHVLLAHGRAVEVLRREAPAASVGIALDLVPAHPLTDTAADREAALESDGFRNRWFLDSVLRGEYPADMLERYASILPTIEDGDMQTIAAPLDFLGVNYYTRTILRADPVRREARSRRPGRGAAHDDGLGGLSGRPLRASRPAARRLRASPTLHHRERCRVRRRPPQRHSGRS